MKQSAAIVLTLCACLGQTSPAIPDLDSAFLASQRAVLQKSLEDDGLKDKLEILKLRRGEYPDTNLDRECYRLEFLFRATGTQQEAQDQFEKFLEAQSAGQRNAFPERWFYRVVHLLGVDRQFVAVYFYVLETEYAVYFDVSSRDLVIQQGANRGYHNSFPIAIPALKTEDHPTIIRSSGSNPKIVDAIHTYLDRYFAALEKTGPEPEAKWKELTEPDYLALTVSGMKSQVIREHKYWEKLMLSIELKKHEEGWKLDCQIDGSYASGLGSRRPSDDAYYLMDAKHYQTDLEAYADHLLGGLKRYLEQDH